MSTRPTRRADTAMFYVVSYDITDNRRRNRLFKAMKGFGSWRQFSVFECELDSGQLERLERVISRLTKKGDDSVRIYPVCGKCLEKVRVFGGTLDRIPQAFIV